MRKLLLFMLSVLFASASSAQHTFEKTYSFERVLSIIEMPDHTYLGSGDSTTNGRIFRIDQDGNLISAFYPSLRGAPMRINDLIQDPQSGGYAACGFSDDTTGNTNTGFYLLMDSLMNNTDSLFYSGGISGPEADVVLRDTNNDFIVALETFMGAGSGTSEAQKIIYPAANSWTVTAGTNHTPNGFRLTDYNEVLFATYNATAAAAATLRLIDETGATLQSFTITDTAMGGSLVFSCATAQEFNGNSLFGVNIEPNSGPNSVVYLNKLDQTFNVIWEKYIDWGMSVNITAITRTMDSCIVLLLNTANGLAIHKMNSAGDSLWTQFHNRPTSGSGFRFSECSDGGFLIGGTYYDLAFNPFGYVLKTDSLGRLLPDVTVDISGATEFCPGDSVVLNAQSGYTYQWSNGDTTQFTTITTSGDYFVTLTDSSGAQAISDTISVIVFSPVIPIITEDSVQLNSTPAVSYQWYLDSVLIVGATSQSYVPLVNGLYMVEVVDSNGCTSSSAVLVVTDVGIHNNSENNLTTLLYPNPANSKVTLKLHNIKSDQAVISIFNSLGSVVKSGSINITSDSVDKTLDISDLGSGNYFVRISDGRSNQYLKLFIEK